MRAGDAGCDLFEERLLHPDELRRLDYIQDLLDLSQEHHLKTHAHTHRCMMDKQRRGKTLT